MASATCAPGAERKPPPAAVPALRLKEAYEQRIKQLPKWSKGKLQGATSGWQQQLPSANGFVLPHPAQTVARDRWHATTREAWMEGGAMVYRCVPHIDNYDLLLPSIVSNQKLICPGCRQHSLEGAGSCLQLRRIYSLEFPHCYAYFHRFKCVGCPGATGGSAAADEGDEGDGGAPLKTGKDRYTNSLDLDFIKLNFEDVVLDLMPFVPTARFGFTKGYLYTLQRDHSINSLGPSSMSDRHMEVAVKLLQKNEAIYLKALGLQPPRAGNRQADLAQLLALSQPKYKRTPYGEAYEDYTDKYGLHLQGPGVHVLRNILLSSATGRNELQERIILSLKAGEIISLDHVFSPARMVLSPGLGRPYNWMLVVCNGEGMVLRYIGTQTTSLKEVENELGRLAVQKTVKYIFVDDPVKMGPTLRGTFSLRAQAGVLETEPIKMDAAHILFSRVGRMLVPNHPLYWVFLQALNKCLFDWDLEDLAKFMAALSDAERAKFKDLDLVQCADSVKNSFWDGKVRRIYKKATESYRLLTCFWSGYVDGPLGWSQDTQSHVVRDRDALSRVFIGILHLARTGSLADPPNLDMYHLGRDGKWHSKRGTSLTECINNEANDLLDTVQGEDMANSRCADRIFRHNKDRAQKLHGCEGDKPDHAYDPEAMLEINELCVKNNFPKRYPYLQEPAVDAETAKGVLGFKGQRFPITAGADSGQLVTGQEAKSNDDKHMWQGVLRMRLEANGLLSDLKRASQLPVVFSTASAINDITAECQQWMATPTAVPQLPASLQSVLAQHQQLAALRPLPLCTQQAVAHRAPGPPAAFTSVPPAELANPNAPTYHPGNCTPSSIAQPQAVPAPHLRTPMPQRYHSAAPASRTSTLDLTYMPIPSAGPNTATSLLPPHPLTMPHDNPSSMATLLRPLTSMANPVTAAAPSSSTSTFHLTSTPAIPSAGPNTATSLLPPHPLPMPHNDPSSMATLLPPLSPMANPIPAATPSSRTSTFHLANTPIPSAAPNTTTSLLPPHPFTMPHNSPSSIATLLRPLTPMANTIPAAAPSSRTPTFHLASPPIPSAGPNTTTSLLPPHHLTMPHDNPSSMATLLRPLTPMANPIPVAAPSSSTPTFHFAPITSLPATVPPPKPF